MINSKEIQNHTHRRVGSQVQQRIDLLKVGGKMQDLPEELWHESFRFYMNDPTRKGGPNMRIIRLDPHKPSLTVTGFVFNKFVHPFENRYITVREAARLQDFPDELVFKGTLGSTQQQIGNAVPVNLAQAVLESVAGSLKKAGVVEHDTLSALSLFSGAGGFDIGAERVGQNGVNIKTRVCTDIWKDACASLDGYMNGRAAVVEQDITQIADPLDFYSHYSGLRNQPELIYGGPPCQSFSQAGKQKGTSDHRGNLIYEFMRFVETLRPKAFVMENVSNLKGVENGQLISRLISDFGKLGYATNATVLTAADYGTPQLRRRVFITGILSTIGKPAFPVPNHSATPSLLDKSYRTVVEAFDNLPLALPHGNLKEELELV